MNRKLEQLAERRALLIAEVSSQRMELAQAFSPLHTPLRIADKGLKALNYLAQHPMLMAGAISIAVVVRPKRWLFMLENAWLLWRMAVAARRKLTD